MTLQLSELPTAVVFDLDGTLLDTEPLYTVATQKLLDPFNHQYSMALKKKCMGGDSRRTAQLTIDEYGLPHSVDEFLDEREQHLRELFPDAPEIEGAGAYIQLLSDRGIPLGLATSSHQHLCDLKLARRDWRDRFRSIICGDSALVVNGKPAPDIFLACAGAIGVAADQCLAFEDSPTGIAAARAAGMTVIAVNSPYVEDSDLAAADHVIDNYLSLTELLG